MKSLGEMFQCLLKSPFINNATFNCVRGLKYFAPPPNFDHIELPEKPKLKFLDKVPQYPNNVKPFKMQKRLRYIRGPELIHNTLIHQQYGLQAKCGGRLRFEHIEMMRMELLRRLDYKRMFAIWRIEAPWQPITKKGHGQRMGGGKGAIDHYVTPIKAERIILEIGGKCEFSEVKCVLESIGGRLPLAAIPVSQKILDNKKKRDELLEKRNQNQFTMRFLIENNMGGCHNWLSPFDHLWHGKYR